MKNILVPTDFSEFALNALYWAKMIGERSKTKIYLLHAIEPIKTYATAADGMYINASIEAKYMDFLKENAEKDSQEIVNHPDFKDLDLEVLISTESLLHAVKHYINSLNIDLLVMGTQGISGLDELLIGSNTQKVVRSATCPILTVRNKPEKNTLKNMVFATNLMPENLKFVRQISQLQEIFDAHLHLLYVNVPNNFLTDREIHQRKEEFLKETDLINFTVKIYNELNEESGILNFAEDIKADLIILASHQRKGLAHFFSGSITEDIVNHATTPVLTFGLKYAPANKTI